MEFAKIIHTKIMGGMNHGPNWSAVMIEGHQYSDPDKIIHRIYHDDNIAVDLIAEKWCEPEEAHEIDETNINGWIYSFEESDLGPQWAYAEKEQLAEWFGVDVETINA
jgi:hypothetical protein